MAQREIPQSQSELGVGWSGESHAGAVSNDQKRDIRIREFRGLQGFAGDTNPFDRQNDRGRPLEGHRQAISVTVVDRPRIVPTFEKGLESEANRQYAKSAKEWRSSKLEYRNPK